MKEEAITMIDLTTEEVEMIKKFRKEKQKEKERIDRLKKGIKMMKEAYDLICENGGRVVIEEPDSDCWEDIDSLEEVCTSRYFDTIIIHP